MDYKLLESVLLGIVSGLTEILPVSSQAHSRLALKFMGIGNPPEWMQLMMHLGMFAAVYLCCQNHILKMIRAQKLSRIPKRKRKRPLDVRSLMDLSLWKTMLLPVILAFFFYTAVDSMVDNQIVMATFLFLNGLILYIPQFLPSSNKDCRSLSRVEGLLMGLGGALFVIPGMSGVGAALSVASVTGVDRKYSVNMVLLMQLGVLAGRIVLDVLAVVNAVAGALSFMVLAAYLLSAVAAFLGTYAAIKILRSLAAEKGFALFSYYCWGLALFTLILSLMA